MNAQITEASIVRHSDDQVGAEVDGEIVLMNIDKGSYYGLDDIATDVWRRLEEPVAVADLCVAVSATYDGDRAEITSDVIALLDELREHGLIAVDDD